jgi:hypothetical protein
VAGVVCRGASSQSDGGLRSWQAEPLPGRLRTLHQGLMARLTPAGYR